MYFPTGTARILSAEPSCKTGLSHPIISVAVSPHKHSFATLTKDALWLWRGRVCRHVFSIHDPYHDHSRLIKAPGCLSTYDAHSGLPG